MSLLLQLTENREIRLEVDLQEWTKAFEQALRNNEVVEVRDPDGGVLGVNPNQVLYWKADDSPQTPLVEPSGQLA